jgi:hypothetical protein
MKRISRTTAESRARRAIAPRLARELRILRQLAEANRRAAEDFDCKEAPHAKALVPLLGRLADDLRAMWLIHSGYPVQAWALEATVHEVAYNVGFICVDDAARGIAGLYGDVRAIIGTLPRIQWLELPPGGKGSGQAA